MSDCGHSEAGENWRSITTGEDGNSRFLQVTGVYTLHAAHEKGSRMGWMTRDCGTSNAGQDKKGKGREKEINEAAQDNATQLYDSVNPSSRWRLTLHEPIPSTAAV